MQPGPNVVAARIPQVAGASAVHGDRDAEETSRTTAILTMTTLTPTMRWPVESRTRVTLRNFWRPVVVILVMAFHSGRMHPAKSASVCCRVPKRHEAPAQFGDDRAWMHCVWRRGKCVVCMCDVCMCACACTCTRARGHGHGVHMPCVCLLGVAIEVAPSGFGRGEPLRRREVVLLIVARLGVISSG